MWSRVRPLFRLLDAHRIEVPTREGVPDVNYAHGWIELKWLEAWPVRDDTLVRLPHFTQEQRDWLERRCVRGGRAYLLLQVETRPLEWLLFNGSIAAAVIGHATRQQLYDRALRTWRDHVPDYNELVRLICPLNLH